jgi:hypothetical protein
MTLLQTEKDIVYQIIDIYFKSRKTEIDKSLFHDITNLIEKNVFVSVTNETVKINISSTIFKEVVLEYIEVNLSVKIPYDIKSAFKLIEKFEKLKKKEFGYENVYNAYSPVIDSVKSHIFYSFHTQNIINSIDFFKSLTKKEQYHYDKYLFETLLLIDIKTEELYSVLSISKSNETITRVPDFCFELGKNKPQLTLSLYDYALPKNDSKDIYILSYALIGLFESDAEKAFSKVTELVRLNPLVAYFTLGRFNYRDEKYIKKCFSLSTEVDKENLDSLLQLPYLYKSLIENANTPAKIREKSFSKMKELFYIENVQLRNLIFMDCRFIKGYEDERYRLLIETFLSKSQDYFKEVSSYFNNYTNPDYFFNLFTMLYNIQYQKLGALIDVEIFTNALSHFWKIDKNKTETHILFLLSHDLPHLRVGAVDLIRSKHRGLYDVNVLELHSETEQLRALEAIIFQSFYNIDKLLPLILKFKHSTHKNVVTYLIANLSDLILNSYHDYLFEKVNELVSDVEFIGQVKLSLNKYHRIKEIKTSINDLNPRHNEQDLMNLYYSLEEEEKHKMIRKINNSDNSFLSTIKQTTIVRGHAWQTGDNEISPLGHFEHSFSLDMRMYSNPDVFDYIHNNFNSNF